MTHKPRLTVLPGRYAVCRLAPNEAIPAWALAGGGFVSITRTASELSIVCAETAVAEDAKREAGWRLFKLEGPFDFALTGILLSAIEPLNAAGVSILAISTYDTDYLLVKDELVETAKDTLRASGHTVDVE